ncbi:MAG: hypothetical protein WC047_06965 [Kiritimatiellales bacterium]
MTDRNPVSTLSRKKADSWIILKGPCNMSIKQKNVPNPLPDEISAYREISQHAKTEITWVSSAYKLAAGLITFIFVVGIWFNYKSSSDFRAETKQEAKQQTEQILAKLTVAETNMKAELDKQMAELSRTVKLRVEQEFEAGNIKQLVETEAKNRIDVIADTLIKDEVARRITPLRDELTALISQTADESKQRLLLVDQRQEKSQQTENELGKLINETHKILAQVQQQADFVMTVISAQNDDRKAYDQLVQWMNDPSFPLRDQAYQAQSRIQSSYFGWLGEGSYKTAHWKDEFDPRGLSIQEIEENWTSIPSLLARGYLDSVWNCTNITKEQKLTFMHNVLTDSRNSLQAADKAARILADESKVNYNPAFVFGPIEEWWTSRMTSNALLSTATNTPIPESPNPESSP